MTHIKLLDLELTIAGICLDWAGLVGFGGIWWDWAGIWWDLVGLALWIWNAKFQSDTPNRMKVLRGCFAKGVGSTRAERIH